MVEPEDPLVEPHRRVHLRLRQDHVPQPEVSRHEAGPGARRERTVVERRPRVDLQLGAAGVADVHQRFDPSVRQLVGRRGADRDPRALERGGDPCLRTEAGRLPTDRREPVRRRTP